MKTILVAVCCQRCSAIVPPHKATKTQEGWVCRAHFSSTPEGSVRERRARGHGPHTNHWSQADEERLILLYVRAGAGPLNLARVAADFGRSAKALSTKAKRLGLTRRDRGKKP